MHHTHSIQPQAAALTGAPTLAPLPLILAAYGPLCPVPAPPDLSGLRSVYFAKALASAFFALIF